MKTYSPLKPSPLTTSDTCQVWGELHGAAAALAIAQLAKTQDHPLCVLCPDIHQAQQLLGELHFFLKGHSLPLLFFPDWETLPYDHFAPHEDLVSERLMVLQQLPHLTQGIVISAISTAMHRLPPLDYLSTHNLSLKKGQTLHVDSFRQQLVNAGYRHVTQVTSHGEFAQRGAILDLFPSGSSQPFRIELFDDDIDTIRYFDPETQRSEQVVDAIRLLPAREYPLNEEGIAHFRQRWRAEFSGNPLESPLYQSISDGLAATGAEYYLPLFYPQLASLCDYLPAKTQIIMPGELPTAANHFWQEIEHRYQQLGHDVTRPLCQPEQVFIPVNELFSQLKSFQQIQINHNKSHCLFTSKHPPQLPLDHHKKKPLAALEEFIKTKPGRILFCAESTGRRETLGELLHEIALSPSAINSWQEFVDGQQELALCVGELEQGLWLTEEKLLIIAESQLFGQQVKQRRLRKRRSFDANTLIKNLAELKIGAPVVHIDYGVGRYLGLELITMGDATQEYLSLEYAGDDKVYVPITALDCISRYTGVDAEHAPLQKLGNKKWQKQKELAAKQIRDVAAELLAIYSERQASPGFAFPSPASDYLRFKNSFPFEETPDQEKAITDVIEDMTQARSMDRLVCGDVGFGKTEVAMRAAFTALQANKQVAVLVPTTLLAGQHWQNFRDRFADWPFNIAHLSRLRTAKENQQAIDGLAAGTVDLVIGTHKLLSESIQFKDLGLLIVDEEHRFGVRQKERIKKLRAHVDILTLTATPIPRTLNMALAGTRDLSLISTPPARRLAVKTFIHEYRKDIIREAILRETLRGGQLYFLHNEVATIDAMAEKLADIVPEARIGIAHGQMRELQLEQVMANFYHQKFNVLLCTTIIESGIDIPTANTILINNADRFGLAQLHQLRGRVGRSHHQAYAYLLTAPEKKIRGEAGKRLDAFSQLEELGAGFMLATHDLEIRGAGELLGDQQSGHIQAIGYTLYMELLDEAVKDLQSDNGQATESKTKSTLEINLNTNAFFPNNFLPDVNTRLILYKRLANCQTNEELTELKVEIIDRFGLLPEPSEELFNIANLRLQAKPLKVNKIELLAKFGYIHFDPEPKIDVNQIIKMIQLHPQQYQMQGANTFRFRSDEIEPNERSSAVSQLLKKISL